MDIFQAPLVFSAVWCLFACTLVHIFWGVNPRITGPAMALLFLSANKNILKWILPATAGGSAGRVVQEQGIGLLTGCFNGRRDMVQQHFGP